MLSFIAHATWIACILFGLPPWAIAQAQKPARDSIECSVSALEPTGDRGEAHIVSIKVSNRGRVPIEPLSFELTTKSGAIRTIRRAPEPSLRRLGRPVAPASTQIYAIFVMANKAELTGSRVRLIECSITTGLKSLDPPCEVGTPTTSKRQHEMGGTVEFAVLPLKNRTKYTLDVILRLHFENPKAATVLVHKRLGPSVTTTATFNDLVYELTPESVTEDQAFTVDLAVPRGARIGAAKLVDWCAVLPDDAHPEGQLAPEVFTAAYAAWLRWTDTVGLHAQFEGKFTTASSAAVDVEGEFTRDRNGVVGLRGKFESRHEEALKKILDLGFADLSRPDTAEAFKLCDPSLERRTPLMVLLCRGPSWREDYKGTRFAIDRDRFLGHNWFGSSEDSMRSEWRTEPMEGGYVVTERKSFDQPALKRPTSVMRWKYQRWDGLLVPTMLSFTEDLGAGSSPWGLTLQLREFVRELEDLGPVPGSATEIVRAAWDRGHRVSKETVDLSCRYLAKCGKDAVWRGAKEVRGQLHFRGFDGLRFRDVRAEVEGVADTDLRDSLGRIVIDRLPMWTGRDFAGRVEFHRVFAGASFSEALSRPGHFEIRSGPYRSLAIQDGLVSSIVFQNGTERRFTWTDVAGRPVVTRVVTGSEVVSADFTPCGAILVPSKMHFQGVFGDEKEWGSEELTLSDFR